MTNFRAADDVFDFQDVKLNRYKYNYDTGRELKEDI